MDDIKNTLIDLYAENTKADYLPELAFYNLIADTDLKIVRDYLKQPFSKTIGLGALSRDPLQNLKYHFVVTADELACVCPCLEYSYACCRATCVALYFPS